MTEPELRAQYNELYRTATNERKMRDRVFPPGHPDRDQKLGEMDRLLEIITGWKDELKARICYEQPPLLDVPKRTEYR